MIFPCGKYTLYFWVILGYFLITTDLLPCAYAGELSPPVDSDNDGVTDTHDKCLNTPQIFKVNRKSRIAPLFEPKHLTANPGSVLVDADGCAIDSDNDSIPDYQDYCPMDSPRAISAGVTLNGCPIQSDRDGTPDYRDKCPNTPRSIATDHFGCPKNL